MSKINDEDRITLFKILYKNTYNNALSLGMDILKLCDDFNVPKETHISYIITPEEKLKNIIIKNIKEYHKKITNKI